MFQPESSGLSAEIIERAQRGEIDNPVFPVLQSYGDLMQDFSSTPSVERRDSLVEDLIAAAPFQLDIETIIATWAHGITDPERPAIAQVFSRTLVAAYVLYDPTMPDTAHVLREFVGSRSLGRAATLGTGYITASQSRLRTLSDEYDRLSIYVNGTADAVEEVAHLVRGNPEDHTRAQAMRRFSKQRNTPFLGAVRENGANATLAIGLSLHLLED